MSDLDSPAGTPGGPLAVPTLDDLPDKLRVHALARLLGRTSKEILATLAELGVEARSAQSSVNRKNAEQVVTALLPDAPVAALPPDDAAPAALEDPAEDSAPAEDARATAGLAPLFAPPAPLFQAPVPAPRSRRRPAADTAAEDTAADDAADDDVSAEDTATGAAAESGAEPEDEEGEGGARRRRRRGRRGRGRGRGAEDAADGEDPDGADEAGEASAETADGAADEAEEDAEADSTDSADGAAEEAEEAEEAGGSRRRRRRRRRRGSAEDSEEAGAADPPNTVTRVRTPRDRNEDDSAGDGVQSVRGSTRLEAKRQRRRDGRDAGRRRIPILSEAEFLARRESVDRAMVVRERGGRVEIAVLEDGVLVEHFVTGGHGDSSTQPGKSIVGNIYLGRVQNVLPSMEAAFVDIGRGRNAVLYAGEVDWDAAGLGGKARRIEQALSSGDSVLVQVTKDPIGHKGARLTTQISLAGRFLVYVPSGGAAGISRKLPDVERRRLKDMLKEIIPGEAGVIIRTASEGVSQEALERDVRRLQAQWEVVKGKAEQTGPDRPKAPALLYEEPDLLIKVVRDQFNEDFSSLVVAGDEAWDTVSGYVSYVAPELVERLHRHVGPTDVFAEYRIDEQMLKALDRKVWLPSGGTLVIDRTEAMTVIDVNTGKFTGSGGNLEETVTRNNLEAAEEIVRQLRLRDIGGIIVIDFIDMVLEANRDLVLRRLTECLARDRTRHQVAEVTSLGLVQMTRKRVGGGLLEHFSTTCEHCRGRGVIVNSEPLVERVETGRGPDREGRRSRGGRGRRGPDQPGRDAGQYGNGGQGGNGPGDRSAAPAPVPVPPTGGPPLPGGDAQARPVPGAGPTPVATGDVAAAGVVDDAAPVTTPAPEPPAEPVAEPGPTAPAAGTAVAGEQGAVPPAFEPATTPPAVHGTGAAGGSVEGAAARNGVHHPAEVSVPRPRRRAARRTAGAPTVAGGEATVAVVTVASSEPGDGGTAEPVAAAPAGVPPQPEPTATSRPRRPRRAASRPAGPPVAGHDEPAAVEPASAGSPAGSGDVVAGAPAGDDPV